MRAPSERARPPTPLSLSFTCRPARRRCRPARPRPGCRGRRRRRRPGRPCSRPRRRRGWQSRGRRRGRWLRGEREEREVSVGSGAVSRRGGGGAQLLSLGGAPPPTARPPPLRGRPPPAGPPPPIARQTNQALTHAHGEQDRGQEGDEAHGCWRVKEKREGNQKGGGANAIVSELASNSWRGGHAVILLFPLQTRALHPPQPSLLPSKSRPGSTHGAIEWHARAAVGDKRVSRCLSPIHLPTPPPTPASRPTPRLHGPTPTESPVVPGAQDSTPWTSLAEAVRVCGWGVGG